MKLFLFVFTLLPVTCLCQTDTLYYTPKQKELANVEVTAKKFPIKTINDLYTSNGCWGKLENGDTIYSLVNSNPGETLYEYLKRQMPEISFGSISAGKSDPRIGTIKDVPRYKGQELGIFVNEHGAGIGMRIQPEYDIERIFSYTFKENGPAIIKFVKNFKCSVGTGPAIVIYTRLKAQRKEEPN